MSNKLFVYGTPGPGRPNEHILGKIGGSWEKASVTGTLHPEGWGQRWDTQVLHLKKMVLQLMGFCLVLIICQTTGLN